VTNNALGSEKKFARNSYRPLPVSLTIGQSNIHGLGLIALESIKAGTYLGETHFQIDGIDDWVRTPLGGFINHSDNNNAKIELVTSHIRGLTTKRDIVKGEEITVFYTLY
jgi:SET domain-containing protein